MTRNYLIENVGITWGMYKKILDIGNVEASFRYCKQKQVENSNIFMQSNMMKSLK